MFSTSVYFNNYDLNTLPGVKVVDYDVDSMPRRNLNSSKLARANKSLLTSAEYSDKTVVIAGFVGGDDWRERQTNFNRLKGYVQDIEGIIRVDYGDSEIEYIGTLNAITKEIIGPNLAFKLSFFCSNPIGRDSTGQQLFAPTVITSSTLTKSFTVDGSFEASPRFNFVITSVSGATNKSLSILNAASSKGIRVTRTWANGDILDVNSDSMEVIVNGESIDFEGQFPKFLPGTRSLQYVDDFSTRNITMSSIYTRQYS